MKGLLIGDPSDGLIQETRELTAHFKPPMDWQEYGPDFSSDHSLTPLLDVDISLIQGPACHHLASRIKNRSVGSHFLKYVDLVIKKDRELWGSSLFSEVFKEVFFRSLENQGEKGSVIFLGDSHLSAPLIQVLCGFGIDEFVFLTLNEEDKSLIKAQEEIMAGLIGVQVSRVDFRIFIQNPTRYRFCFVTQKEYSQETLSDMSYFHFLSSQSMVFDMVGSSNFAFDEVRALGVKTMEFSKIRQVWGKALQKALKKALKIDS